MRSKGLVFVFTNWGAGDDLLDFTIGSMLPYAQLSAALPSLHGPAWMSSAAMVESSAVVVMSSAPWSV